MTAPEKASSPGPNLPKLCHALMERAPVPMAELEGKHRPLRESYLLSFGGESQVVPSMGVDCIVCHQLSRDVGGEPGSRPRSQVYGVVRVLVIRDPMIPGRMDSFAEKSGRNFITNYTWDVFFGSECA